MTNNFLVKAPPTQLSTKILFIQIISPNYLLNWKNYMAVAMTACVIFPKWTGIFWEKKFCYFWTKRTKPLWFQFTIRSIFHWPVLILICLKNPCVLLWTKSLFPLIGIMLNWKLSFLSAKKSAAGSKKQKARSVRASRKRLLSLELSALLELSLNSLPFELTSATETL